MDFDWHSGALTRTTPVTPHYKNTQNVRRFMLEHDKNTRPPSNASAISWMNSKSVGVMQMPKSAAVEIDMIAVAHSA